MTESVAPIPKANSYLMVDGSDDKKAKRTRKCVIISIIKFYDYKNCLFKNEIILKSKQIFESEAHNVYTKEINNIGLSSNDDNKLQTFDRITWYPYGTSVGNVFKTELLSNYIWLIDGYTNKNKTEHYPKWPYIPDHPYKTIIGGSGSGKTNALLNLINNQPDIDKIYLYAKTPYQVKYQYLIDKREKVGLKHYDDPKAFIEYSNDMQAVYKNIEEYNLGRKRKVLIVFDDMITDIINNKKLNPIVTELNYLLEAEN